MRIDISFDRSKMEWHEAFQWTPAMTTDGQHFVWLETVIRRWNPIRDEWEVKLKEQR